MEGRVGVRLSDAVEQITDEAKALREDVARRGVSNGFLLHCWRGMELVATVRSPMDRDLMLSAATIAIPGFGADIVGLNVDTYLSTTLLNPTTKQPWESGEMSAAAIRGLEAVVDTLVIRAWNRAGDAELRLLPYRADHRAIAWRTDVELPAQSGDLGVGGVIEEAVLDGLRSKPLDLMLADRHRALLSWEEERAALDVFVWKWIRRDLPTVTVELAARWGSDRYRYLQRRGAPIRMIR